MGNDLIAFIKLTWPINTAMLIVVFVGTLGLKGVPLNVELALGIISIEQTFSQANTIIPRLALGMVAVCLLVFHGFRDFSGFFPVHYRMRVFFDDPGLETSLKQLKQSEKRTLNIEPDWKTEKQMILDRIIQ